MDAFSAAVAERYDCIFTSGDPMQDITEMERVKFVG
jgi:hypothetical protein